MPTAVTVRRRRRLQKDTRPDWRDPEMPCWTTCRMSDGSTRTMYVPPTLRQEFAIRDLAGGLRGDWRSDPTYNLRRRATALVTKP